MKYLDKEETLKYLDKEEEEEVEVFETLCFNFCGISEKKLKYLNKEEKRVFRKKLKYLDQKNNFRQRRRRSIWNLKHCVLIFVGFLKRSWSI